MPDNVLTVNGLKTQFPTRDGVVSAVDDLSFEVNAGEMVGIVGESGCGKSTAALSILRLVPHPGKIVAGEIILEGQDIVPISETAMRKLRGPGVAMIFQDALAALDPTAKIGTQLMEPLQTQMGMSAANAQARAIDLLGRVGIPSPETRLNNYSYQFSGGMRQRVMIAMALSCNPRLLLADEPTTALDVTIQRQILDLIVTLRAETGAGVILITHDVGVVAETCDRVVVMYAGKVVETGRTQDVFVTPMHPYTRGLLTATLGLEHAKDRALPTIPGMPPDLIDLPPGCAFATRCRERDDGVCREQMPSLVQVGDEHFVSCWLAWQAQGNLGQDKGEVN